MGVSSSERFVVHLAPARRVDATLCTPAQALLDRIARRLVHAPAAESLDVASRTTPIKPRRAPEPGWHGRGEWMKQIEAQLAKHDQQLGEHAKRLAATERDYASLNARVSDYAYELDMLTRISLRNARRLDQISRTTVLDEDRK